MKKRAGSGANSKLESAPLVELALKLELKCIFTHHILNFFLHILLTKKAEFQSILVVGIGSSSGADSSDSNENEPEPESHRLVV